MSSSRVVGDAIAEYQQKCPGKRALMFLWSVRASEEMAINFNAVGISAAHIDGTTNERVRDRYISEFRQGSIKVLTNCEIVTEGFDVPAIEACFLLRPTQSLALYCQMVGRALRPYPGKEFALLMDHSGLAFRHGLPDEIRDWTLDGEDRKPRDPQEVPIRQCSKCFAVLPVQARSCKYCGFVFVVTPREVDQQSGELRELGKDEIAHLKRVRIDERRQAQTYDALLRIEQRLGYKRGWAKHVFEARQRKEG
jgi:superfamily II DNA or RNA helicase